MLAFVPGFTHDIFVSYVHVDNRTFGKGIGWVETLVEDLREALIRILKANQNPFTEELLKQLRNQ